MPHKLPLIVAALLALAAPVALAGPASAGGQGPRTWTVQVGSESRDQSIQGMAFLPTDIFVDAGDTVAWAANAAEIHTVTFLATGQSIESTQPFDPGIPAELFKQGGGSYDGHSYYNSGVLTNVSTSGLPYVGSYSLAFPATGNYTYYCLVHGAAMKGTVHVAKAGEPYPYTQKQYNRQSRVQAGDILRDGQDLWDETADLADSHHVYAGADDGTAMLMRFIQPTVKVHVGDTVTFINNGMGEPHTVTFGTEPADVFAPLGTPTAYGGGQLNSGLMPPAPGPGSRFAVTFTTAGTFDYICGLHDYLGMVGKVVVQD
ncbi:plastocyanin/azurin family copper-binding protein [Pseudarthrobacter sp. P1]|uniref:plastocyanin/azurin family copper-binding protein n=1 Tax=Pseudarthrobacter sp. P1 TaxID=3418418 RepID=UPI003CEEAE6B